MDVKISYIYFVLVFQKQTSKKISRNMKSHFLCNKCQSDNSKIKLSENKSSKLYGKLEDIIVSINCMGAQFDGFNKKIYFVLEEIKI